MLRRMIGAAMLRREVYEEVEADPAATFQALSVVVLVALATGIGFLGLDGGAVSRLIIGTAMSVAVWAVWALMAYLVGVTILRTPETKADWGQLARAMGFAQSPGILRIFVFVPGLGPVIFQLTLIWQLVAVVVAIRQALDYDSPLRAAGVAILSYLPILVLTGIIASKFFPESGVGPGSADG